MARVGFGVQVVLVFATLLPSEFAAWAIFVCKTETVKSVFQPQLPPATPGKIQAQVPQIGILTPENVDRELTKAFRKVLLKRQLDVFIRAQKMSLETGKNGIDLADKVVVPEGKALVEGIRSDLMAVTPEYVLAHHGPVLGESELASREVIAERLEAARKVLASIPTNEAPTYRQIVEAVHVYEEGMASRKHVYGRASDEFYDFPDVLSWYQTTSPTTSQLRLSGGGPVSFQQVLRLGQAVVADGIEYRPGYNASSLPRHDGAHAFFQRREGQRSSRDLRSLARRGALNVAVEKWIASASDMKTRELRGVVALFIDHEENLVGPSGLKQREYGSRDGSVTILEARLRRPRDMRPLVRTREPEEISREELGRVYDSAIHFYQTIEFVRAE